MKSSIISTRNEMQRKPIIHYSLSIIHYIFISSLLILHCLFIACLMGCGSKIKVPELNVVLSADLKPFLYTERDTLKGIEVELLTMLEKQLKIPLRQHKVNFQVLLETLHNGSYDLAIGGITITDKRSEVFDFTIPYYDATQVILCDVDNPVELDTLNTFAKYRIGVINGSSSLFFVEENLIKQNKLPIGNLRKYTSQEALFTALKAKEVQLIGLEKGYVEQIVVAIPSSPTTTSETPYMVSLQIVYQNDLTEYYGIALKKGSPYLKPINQALTKILQSKEWREVFSEKLAVRS